MKRGVAVKILSLLLILTSFIFLIIGGISWQMMTSLGNYATQSSLALGDRAIGESTSALQEDAEVYLLRLATDQAEITNMVFERIAQEMNVINDHGTDIINGLAYNPQPLYTASEKPDEMGENGVIHHVPGCPEDLVMKEALQLSSFQPVFSTLFHADNLLTALYVASDSGTVFFFPWTPRISTSFDPRTRDWYHAALANQGLVWTDPYVDATGSGLLITCSKKLQNEQKNVTWVINADITIETINQRIITTQLGEDGYAFLINQKGDVISRPGLTAGSIRWDESFNTDNFLQSNNSDLQQIAQEMVLGLSGVARCRFEEGDKFIAYAPVKSVGWSIGLVMPVESAIAPVLITGGVIRDASMETQAHIDEQISFLQNILIVSFLLLFIGVAGVAVYFSRIITEPVKILREGAIEIGSGNLETSVDIHSGDEFEELAGVFNRMAKDLKDHIAELRRTTAEKERFTRELEIAQGIQKSFLPDTIPDISGMELAVFSSPALEVGGDFYDFIPVADDEWGLVIADVSGKGVPAALFMALSRTLIRVSATWKSDPAAAINEANNLICRDSKASMFVTLFYLIIDGKSRRLTYVNAGHNPPIMLTREHQGDITLLKAEGIALGVMEGIDLASVTVPLQSGDMVALYTDGITEAMNAEGEEYGMERFSDLLIRNQNRHPDELIEAIRTSVKEFTGETPQSDDITLILIRAV